MEWTDKYPHSAYVWNKAQFDEIDPNTIDHLLGLFNRSHMEYNHDNPQDLGGEPTIAEMTDKAIDILQKNEKGFFPMVESGRLIMRIMREIHSVHLTIQSLLLRQLKLRWIKPMHGIR